MSKNKKKLPSLEPAFEGYTLDEIRYRLLVNRLKINMQKERISTIIMPGLRETGGIVGRFMPAMAHFDSWLKYADVALLSFTLGRKLMAFIRRHK